MSDANTQNVPSKPDPKIEAAARSLTNFFDGVVVSPDGDIKPRNTRCWCGEDVMGYDSEGSGYCWFHQPDH
jgi:hypothetical protein